MDGQTAGKMAEIAFAPMILLEKLFCWFVGLLAILLVFGVGYWVYIIEIPSRRTTEIVRKECRKLLAHEEVVPDIDFWDAELIYDRQIDETEIVATVTSKGRDGELGTSDDISMTMRDMNKSEILGEYIGSRAKRFGKGLIKGLTDENEFNK